MPFFPQNRELLSDDVAVRQQALLLLNDVMHRREDLASALREGGYCTSLAMIGLVSPYWPRYCSDPEEPAAR